MFNKKKKMIDRLKEEINTLIKPSKTIKKTPKKTSKQSEKV